MAWVFACLNQLSGSKGITAFCLRASLARSVPRDRRSSTIRGDSSVLGSIFTCPHIELGIAQLAALLCIPGVPVVVDALIAQFPPALCSLDALEDCACSLFFSGLFFASCCIVFCFYLFRRIHLCLYLRRTPVHSRSIDHHIIVIIIIILINLINLII
jgi:hypothetical protein